MIRRIVALRTPIIFFLVCLAFSFLSPYFLVITIPCGVMAIGDICCRWKEYNRILAIYLKKGNMPYVVLGIMRHSKCQRDVCVSIDNSDRSWLYFYVREYKWYHFFPDTLVKTPRVFFSFRFLNAQFNPF